MAIRRTKFIKKSVIALASFLTFSFAGAGLWGGALTPFYRIKEEYARVLTEMDGDRSVDKRVGLHLRINSLNPKNWVIRTKEFSKRKEYIHLDKTPTEGKIPEPYEMQAADKIKFQGAGLWTYRIVDLEKFGIKIGPKALEMLVAELNGIAKAKIQTHDVEYIVTRIDDINKEINNCKDIKDIEKEYGIKIDSFRLTHATYPKEMNEKTAEAKGIKIVSEAAKEAADNYASAKKKMADANTYYRDSFLKDLGITSEEGKMRVLEIIANIHLYDVLEKRPPGEHTYIFTDKGSVPNLTLPNKDKTLKPKEKESDKKYYFEEFN